MKNKNTDMNNFTQTGFLSLPKTINQIPILKSDLDLVEKMIVNRNMTIGKQKAFEIINRAQSVLLTSNFGLPQYVLKKTKDNYLAEFERLDNLSLPIDSIAKNQSLLALAAKTKYKNTWYFRRASIKFSCMYYLKSYFAQQKKLQMEINNNPINNIHNLKLEQEWLSLATKMLRYLNLLDNIPGECPIPVGQRKKRVSKRHHMRGLVKNWREEIINNVNPKWKLQILVLAVTGCRPSELLRGVIIRIENNQLICQISGSKVRDRKIQIKQKDKSGKKKVVSIIDYHAGQEIRELSFALGKKDLVAMLAEYVGTGTTVSIDNACCLTTTIRYIAKKLWPKRKKSITAYCFRHALASDMKNSDMQDDAISTALGHAVSRTKTFYGHPKMSTGGHTPNKVLGSSPIKQSKNSPLSKRRRNKRASPT